MGGHAYWYWVPYRDDVLKASAEEGTRSILDIAEVGEVSDYGVAGPVPEEHRVALSGTAKPTRAQVDDNREGLFDLVERGKAICLVAYDAGGAPSELFFLGYSSD